MSSVDPSKPTSGRAYTADVRENFRVIKEELEAFSDVSSGDALIGVKLDANGSVARTQHDKNEELPSVNDFSGEGDYPHIFIPDTVTKSSSELRQHYWGPGGIEVGGVDVIRDTRGVFQGPAALGHYIGDVIYRRRKDGSGEILNELSQYYPAGAFDPFDSGLTIYYVDPVAGNDANTGANWANALKRVSAALAKADVDVVICKGGETYFIDSGGHQGTGTYSGTRDISLIAVGAKARFTTARSVTWSEHVSLTNVWQSSSTGGTIVKVVDIRSRDENGDFVELTNVASQALVDVTPGSWTYASSVVYVRLSDDATPDTNTLALRDFVQGVQAPGVKWYMKNIHFIGGSAGAFRARSGDADTIVIAEDCWFTHQHSTDGFQIKDIGLAIAIRCRASKNANDGFNYHELNSLSPDFIEIDCVGINNLATGTGNGSSAHEDVRGIRVNCDYFANLGPGVADISTAKTLNINCTSRANSGNSSSCGFTFENTAEAWIDGGAAFANQGPDLRVTNTAIVHIRDFDMQDAAITDSNGTGTVDRDFS